MWSSFVFDISSESKLKLHRYPKTVMSFPLFKLDELLITLRNLRPYTAAHKFN